MMTSSEPVALIADQDDFFRMALRTMLVDELGFSAVLEAVSLDQALEKLAQASAISLATFELNLPDIKSPACLAAVRDTLPELRTVVVSRSDRKQDVLRALAAGVHGYVPKSIGPAQLMTALKRVMDGQIYVPTLVAAIPSPSAEAQTFTFRSAEVTAIESLTPRQLEVLELLVQGKTNKEIAKDLNLGEGTVKVHMTALFRTFGVNSRAAVAVAAAQLFPVEERQPNRRLAK